MDKMINNLSGSITKGKYELSWYINTKTKKGNMILKDTQTKITKRTELKEVERETETIGLGRNMHHLVEGGTQHLIYENKYMRIYCTSNKGWDMIKKYIAWEQIKEELK